MSDTVETPAQIGINLPAYERDALTWLRDTLAASPDVVQAHIDVNPTTGTIEAHMANGTVLAVRLMVVPGWLR